MFGECLDRVRAVSPLIHSITNYVTANDVANVLLACGASPIMADDEQEVAEITTLCAGLTLNIGTLNHRTIPAMLLAGKTAGQLGHPIVLDPVGAGASKLRTTTAQTLLRETGCTAVRGNISEIRALAGNIISSRGVDADKADTEVPYADPSTLRFIQEFSQKNQLITVATGSVDVITDGRQTILIHNGRPEMRRITGTGCQLSAMVAAFLAANPDHPLISAAAAVALMGVAGEQAWSRMVPGDGNITYRSRLISAIDCMTGIALEKGVRYEFFEK